MDSLDELIRKLRKKTFVEAQKIYNEIQAEIPLNKIPLSKGASEYEAQMRYEKVCRELLHRTGWTEVEYLNECMNSINRELNSVLSSDTESIYSRAYLHTKKT